MNIDVLKSGRMQQTGSSLFRAIQNNKLPTLDLLTREVVQNSLDASSEEQNHMEFEVLTGEFDSFEFIDHLEEIEDNFYSKYPENNYKYLAFLDKKTNGLTGPLHDDLLEENDRPGNLLKLIYHIMKPQEQEGAGGSWGLGKTVYFRVGIGLVLYYSRIKLDNNRYQSRLAVTLVENEKEDTIISKSKYMNYAGITWWGHKFNDNGETCPITDDDEIEKILNCFNISPYEGEETGTMVLIPYIDEEKLLKNVRSIYTKDEIVLPWTESLEEYFSVAIQRWYCPRINNTNYKLGTFLRVKINGEYLEDIDFIPVFKIIKELYNENYDFFKEYEDEVKVKKVNLRREFENDGSAGVLSFIRVSKKEIGMFPPLNYYSPWYYCNHDEFDDNNPPIICFTRKPCLIINYEFESDWCNGIPKTDNDHFLIGIFKLNSQNTMAPKPGRKEYSNLEQYIRSIELGDHSSWYDEPEFKIVAKIKTNVSKYISQEYLEVEDTIELEVNEALGRQVAALLLPPTGFGNASSITKNENSGETSGAERNGKNSKFKILKTNFLEKHLIHDFDLYPGENNNSIFISINVEREQGSLGYSKWIEEFGDKYPFFIEKFEVISFSKNKYNEIFSNLSIDKEKIKIEFLDIECKLNMQNGFAVGVTLIGDNLKESIVTCKLTVGSFNRSFKGSMSVYGKEVFDHE